MDYMETVVVLPPKNKAATKIPRPTIKSTPSLIVSTHAKTELLQGIGAKQIQFLPLMNCSLSLFGQG